MPTSRRHGSKGVRKRTKNDFITGLLGGRLRRILSDTFLAVYYRFLTFVAEIAARTASVGEVYTAPFVVDTHTHTTHKIIMLRIHFTHTHTRARASCYQKSDGSGKTANETRERTTSDLKCRLPGHARTYRRKYFARVDGVFGSRIPLHVHVN